VGADVHGKRDSCFVVMPVGRNAIEKKWFSGWYEVVIKPAIIDANYEPFLAAAEEQPSAINDDIRTHLAFDPMVVVDLGGYDFEEPPNPNVMYELGVRHAFGMPLVMMAWEGQRLPFDVSNQRAIMTQRGFADIENAKRLLTAFIMAANEGRYYNPMEAVGRVAALDTATIGLEEGSIVRALVEEVRDLRTSLSHINKSQKSHFSRKRPSTVKRAMGSGIRSEVWKNVSELEVDPATWGRFLSMHMDEAQFELAKNWAAQEWVQFFNQHRPVNWVSSKSSVLSESADIPDAFLELVDDLMGPQPWKKGQAREVAEKLEVTNSSIANAVKKLIKLGRRNNQNGGVVFEDENEFRTVDTSKRTSVSEVE